MNLYQVLAGKVGSTSANLIVVLIRAIAIMGVVLLSDIGFTTFTYLQLGR